jgi:hypothetical protein
VIFLAGPWGGLQASGRVMIHPRVVALAVTGTIHLAGLHGGYRPLHHGHGLHVVGHVLRIGGCSLL